MDGDTIGNSIVFVAPLELFFVVVRGLLYGLTTCPMIGRMGLIATHPPRRASPDRFYVMGKCGDILRADGVVADRGAPGNSALEHMMRRSYAR